MNDLPTLLLRAAFVENMPLTLFLGLCTFLALSKRTGSAIGLGIAVTAVMGVTLPLNYIIYHALLAPGAWAWAGMPDIDLSYLKLIALYRRDCRHGSTRRNGARPVLSGHLLIIRRISAASDGPLRYPCRQSVHGRPRL